MSGVTENMIRLLERGSEIGDARCSLYRLERVTGVESLEPGLYEVRDRDGLPSAEIDVREPVKRTSLIRAIRGVLGPRLVESDE